MYYIGLDVHKKTIAFCIKRADGEVHREGTVNATRQELDNWLKALRQPWTGALEATIFTGWIYDYLRPHAVELKVAHPLMVHERERQKGNHNRATLAVARKLVAYLLAVDRREEPSREGRNSECRKPPL